MTSIIKTLVCWVFGECQKTQEAHAAFHDLERRVARLESETRRERARHDWRPGDAFRVR